MRVNNTKFEKVYVISLIYNKDRRLFITKQLQDLGIPFEFIYGVDYYNIKTNRFDDTIEYPDLTITNCGYDNVDHLNNDKMYGCDMAHYQAVLQAYELGYNNVLIIEDDACFLKDVDEIKFALNCMPPDADYVTYSTRFIDPQEYKLYTEFQNKGDASHNNFIEISNKYLTLCGTMMYALMNRKTMKLYLDNQRKQFCCPDWVNGIYKDPIIKRYGTLYSICLDQYHVLKYNNAKNIINTCNNYDFCYEQTNIVKDYNDYYNPNDYDIKYNISNINTKLENEIDTCQRSVEDFRYDDQD